MRQADRRRTCCSCLRAHGIGGRIVVVVADAVVVWMIVVTVTKMMMTGLHGVTISVTTCDTLTAAGDR